ncbi:hypothetical protein Thiowin_05034 [Thiorhodovibrio winogradskyi]|uniref:Uncharacterized protein n=1 Tax=Thiorhodovibrio winogradskyi TaxID=77007 RepID=A0ABZ0SJ58_9GAMM
MRERCLAAFAKTFFSAGPSALATCGGEWLCVRADPGMLAHAGFSTGDMRGEHLLGGDFWMIEKPVGRAGLIPAVASPGDTLCRLGAEGGDHLLGAPIQARSCHHPQRGAEVRRQRIDIDRTSATARLDGCGRFCPVRWSRPDSASWRHGSRSRQSVGFPRRSPAAPRARHSGRESRW